VNDDFDWPDFSSPNTKYLVARSFAKLWADGTLRQVERYRERLKRAKVDSRAFDRGDGEGLTGSDVSDRLDEAWVEQHLLMVSAWQFEKWAQVMASLRGESRPKEMDKMRLVRNALEHLDETDLTVTGARPASKRDRALTELLPSLPGGELPLEVSLQGDRPTVFGLIEVDEIEKACQELADEIFAETTEHDVASYIDWMIDQERGK
jgi:hypothetical protein